jgi:tetratricopeptide (TPR) repeat protein
MTQRDDVMGEQFYALHLRGQGRLDDALEIYRKRLVLEPLNARTRSQLAVTLWQKGVVDEALLEARIAVESEPDNYAIRTILVRFLMEHKRWSEALAECQELVRTRGEVSLSYTLLGDTYHGMGDLKAAIGAYEVAACRADPDTFDALGQLYEEAGRLDDAINIYRKLLGFFPRFRIGRFHLGKALAASGRVVEARHEWRRLLERRDWVGRDRGPTEPAPDEAAILASEYLEQYRDK